MSTISEAALFARLKRKLWTNDRLRLRRCAEHSRWVYQLGRYYATNESRHIMQTDIDLSELGVELGVILADERLEN